MTGQDANPQLAAATQSLAKLEGHAILLRAEIIGLQAQRAALRDDARGRTPQDLLEANQHLVLAALEAQAVAEEARRHRDLAARASQHDALTDSPNRAAMLERLHIALAGAQRRQTHLAVLFVDIDEFKAINDTFGHPVGDQVLRSMARRLHASVRETDTVGRFGGEEFLVLLDDLASTNDVQGIVEQLLAVVSEPESIAGHVIDVSASVGIAFYPDDAMDAAALIACADAAMYRAKRRGPGGYAFCHDVERSADGALQIDSAPATGRSGKPDRRARHVDLQEANGKLVRSALDAQAGESQARSAQARQQSSMAMAAHELRNPLTPIRLAAGLLQRVGDDLPRLTRLRDIIEAQVVHIERLVDDLLDGSRLNAGKLRLDRGQIDLAWVLETAVLTCRPTMEARQQQLRLDMPAAGAFVLEADRTRLVQVFSNLLDNASKYTPEGGCITLATTVSGDSVLVSISDTGIGIPAGALERVFELFVQDSSAVEFRSAGLGIGLAIVRELVEAHGGTVSARSEGKDQGSTFVVTLPVPAAGNP